MEIRIATEQDMKYMISSRIEMLRVVNHLPADYYFGDTFLERSEDYFRHGDHTTVLALEEDEVVGCATICYITVMPTFDHPSGSRAHIMNVYTRASYRRRGIARSMMELLMAEARRRGVTELALDATPEGRPLYASCGFADTCEGMVLSL